MISLKTTFGVWAALGIIGRADLKNIILTLPEVGLHEYETRKQQLHPGLCFWVQADILQNLDKKDYPYGRLPAHYLCSTAWRLNDITEHFSYDEQENILNELQSGKFQSCKRARFQKIGYNLSDGFKEQYELQELV